MADTEALTGTCVTHYRILEKLGGGGMGVVYKAEDTRLERFAALKFLPPEFANDRQMRERFLREARAASALNHPNICTIYEVGEADGRVFIAMEFLDGVTLRELVRQGPVPPAQLLNIAVQVLDALEVAHDQGIIHRDIKLANISVTKNGRAKILDFGLAKKSVSKPAPAVAASADGRNIPEEQLTSGLAALGTAAYMSPEQALGKPLDARTDLFSFGIVLYEMATGRAPFQGDTTGMLLLSIVQEIPEPVRQLNPEMPEGLQQVINKCLQKDRTQRYQSAAEIREDLQLLARDLNGQAVAVAGRHEKVYVPSGLPMPPSRDSSERPTPSGEPALLLKGKSTRKMAALAAAVALALIFAASLYIHSRNRNALKARDAVVLADFTNTTGEPMFDRSLRQAARFDLEQSPFLNVLSDRRVSDFLQQMGRPAGQRLTVEVSREVCLRSNSKALIAGWIEKFGGRYVIAVRAVTCDTQKEIASSQAEAFGQKEVLHALDQADTQLRQKLGESLPSIEKYDRSLEESTTSSLEALQEYTDGLQAFQRIGSAEAIPHFRRAIELDPNFAQAYASLGAVLYSAGETLAAEEAFRRAYELRNRVSERERFSIMASYFRRDTGQTDQAIETCLQWIHLYPDDYGAHLALGGAYLSAGEFEKSVQVDREAIQLSPDRTQGYINAIVAYKDLERYDEAKAIFAAARARNLDNDILRINRYVIAFVEGDKAAMQEQLKWAEGKAGLEDRLVEDWADTQAYYGHYTQAREIANQAITAALRDGLKERAVEHQAHGALREAEVGNRGLVRQTATRTLAASDGLYVKVLIALSLAKVGESAQAQKLADGLSQDEPVHVLMQNYYVPTIRAAIKLNQDRPDEAIAILKPAAPFEMTSSILDGLEPAYLRGQAYLEVKMGREAAAEFQKLLDHPGLVEMSVTGALARLQLGRAEELSGSRESARRHYQDFFALWKDADPDLPVLQQAKAEYAKLR